MLKKLLLFILLIAILIGCSKSEKIGYTYEMDENTQIRELSEITYFSYDIDKNNITGIITIEGNESRYNAVLNKKAEDYDSYIGTINYNNQEMGFSIMIFDGKSVTGGIYDMKTNFKLGYVIEEIDK